ncbi:MAG TPA: hypothetical protein VGK54_12240 [Chloroflexota bacterium]
MIAAFLLTSAPPAVFSQDVREESRVVRVLDERTLVAELAGKERVVISELDLSGLIDVGTGNCCADPQVLVGARLEMPVIGLADDGLQVALIWLDDWAVQAGPPIRGQLRFAPRPQSDNAEPARPQAPAPTPIAPLAMPSAPATAQPTATTGAPAAASTPTPGATPDRTGSANLNPDAAAPCGVGQIKASTRSKIYHLPASATYARTRNSVACFDTEAQAQAAGYRRSRN